MFGFGTSSTNEKQIDAPNHIVLRYSYNAELGFGKHLSNHVTVNNYLTAN